MTKNLYDPEHLLRAEIEAAIDALPTGDFERLRRLHLGLPLEYSEAVDRAPLLRILDALHWERTSGWARHDGPETNL